MLTNEPLIDILPHQIKIAIDRLKYFEPKEGYWLAFSGGKDSIVIKKIADLAGVKYEAHYNLTTIDPPELVKYIRKFHTDVIIDHPKKPFLTEMSERGFPTRQARWCCSEFKEKGGTGRFVITGVRWEESNKRSKRKMVEFCYKDKRKKYMNLIIEWTKLQIWEFIKKYNLPYCKLYDKGWERIGCLFCPMAGKRRLIEAKLYPKYVKLFIKYFEKLYKKKLNGDSNISRWKNGEDMFWWWLNEKKYEIKSDPFVLFE